MPSLLEALERKYFSDDDDDCQFEENTNQADDPTATGSGPAVAAGGGQKRLISIFIPRLPPLQCVPELLVLNDCDIDSAGDLEAMRDKCQRVRELDLAQNKLRDWSEVFQILRYMPRIQFLNLSKNHLSGPTIFNSRNLSPDSFSNLRGVVLNGTYLDWASIDVLLENLPVLEELHLSLNNYKEVLLDTPAAATQVPSNDNSLPLSPPPTPDDQNVVDFDANSCDLPPAANVFPRSSNDKCLRGVPKTTSPHSALKTLHFTGNPVENWQEICRLGRLFPALETLVLADCPIKSIDLASSPSSSSSSSAEHHIATTTTCDTETDSTYQSFLNLVFLNLSCANINSWSDIDRLSKFPKLRNLRVNNWPLWDRLECTEHERRQLLIARLPAINMLNGGGFISANEREAAERAFIRFYMDKPIDKQPSRYASLVAKHGNLDPLVNINLKPDKRIKVFFTFEESTTARMVDIYRTVGDLKVKLEKVVNLPHNRMRLYYLDQDYRDFGPEEMKYPNKRLYSYNIRAGDEIIIDQKK